MVSFQDEKFGNDKKVRVRDEEAWVELILEGEDGRVLSQIYRGSLT